VDSIGVFLKNSTEMAEIDEDDMERVYAHTWRLVHRNNQSFPVARIDGADVRLSRFIMHSSPNDGFFVEHVNGNHLDCRKDSLRRVPAPFDPSTSWDRRRRIAVASCYHLDLTKKRSDKTYTCTKCGTTFVITATKTPDTP